MPEVTNMVRVLQQADASFMPDKTPEQVAETLKDPVAAGSFYDVLKQRYPESVDLERGAFIEQTTGLPAKKFKPSQGKVNYLAEQVKTKYPDFKGNVSSTQLAQSWQGVDAAQIYKDLSELDGFVDMPYGNFEQLMSEDDPHVPVKEDADGSMLTLTWQGALKKWWKGDSAEKREITDPETFTGDEDPLGWGIRKMGNYEDRMSLYNSSPEREQRGRFQIGNEAIGLFEGAASDAVAAAKTAYEQQYGQGAFEEFLSDYHTTQILASMNPDPNAAANEVQAFFNLNAAKFTDPKMKNALNALRGLAMAANSRRNLLKQNPDEVKRQLELEKQREEGDKNILESAGDWALRAGGRTTMNFGALFNSEYLYKAGEETVERHQPLKVPQSHYYITDSEGRKIIVDPDSRAIQQVLDSDGNTVDDYYPDLETAQKVRTAELSYETGTDAILYQVGEVIGDLIIDAGITGGVAKMAGVALAPKTAMVIGTISSGAIRTQSAAMQDALAHGATRGEAYRDQLIKGLMIGSTSLINPIEGALASRVYSSASGKILSKAVSRYSMGKITYMDMLKEIAGAAGRSAIAESVEETVQDFVLDRGYNSLVYGDRFTVNPQEIAETIAVSALVGALGGSVSEIRGFSKSGMAQSAIKTVLENPKLVEQYLEGVRKVDPELAAEKGERIAQITKQLKTLNVPANAYDTVAAALMERNQLVDEYNAIGKDLPEFLKERKKADIEKLDMLLDSYLQGIGKAKRGKQEAPQATEEAPPSMADLEDIAKEPEKAKKVKTKPPVRDIPEEAWKLQNSNNRNDAQGYEAWRQAALDRKPKDMLPDEVKIFGSTLDPDKTIREQVGEKAGIPKPNPRVIPESVETFEKAMKVPGFLVGPEVQDEVDEEGNPTGKRRQTNNTVVLLSKVKRDEGDPDMFYYGEERNDKMFEVKKTLEEVKKRGGTVEDFHKALAEKNIVIGLGKDVKWNQSITGLVSKDYQDAVIQSYLDYEKPPAPKLEKVTVSTKEGKKEFVWNNVSERWEDEKGAPAKGQRLAQIKRVLKGEDARKELEALVNKIVNGETDFSPEEMQLRQNNTRAVEAMLKERRAKEEASKKPKKTVKGKKKSTVAKTTPDKDILAKLEELEERAVAAEEMGLRQLAANIRKLKKDFTEGKASNLDAPGNPLEELEKLRELRKNRLALIEHMAERAEKKFPTSDKAKKIAAKRTADLNTLQQRNRSLGAAHRSAAEVTSSRTAARKAAKTKGEVKLAYEMASRIFPTMQGAGIKVYMHDTLASYADGLAAHLASADRYAVTTAGVYVAGEIHIFTGSEDFSAHKALHEAIHPMLMELISLHPEVYSNFVKELVSNEDLFNKYWKGFAWKNYTNTVPKSVDEARQLMETLDEEALTEMLASDTMRKVLEGMPKQKRGVREFLRDLLQSILDAVGLSAVSDSLFKTFDPQPEVFANFFEDLTTVDDFSTRFAEVLLKKGAIPLSRAFTADSERFASFEDQQRRKNQIEELYQFMDELIKFSDRPPSLRDVITMLAPQIAEGTFDTQTVKDVYDETITGDIGATTGFQEWFKSQSPGVLRSYRDTDIEHNKAALKALSERLGMKVFQKTTKTLPQLQIEAANTEVFHNSELAYNVAMSVLSGDLVPTAITDAQALAMAYQIEVAVQGMDDAMSLMDQMEDEGLGSGDVAYMNEAARYAALHEYVETIKSALDRRGSELGRALSFLRYKTRSSTAQLERAVTAVFRFKKDPKTEKEAKILLNHIERYTKKLTELEDKFGPAHAEALRREFIRRFSAGEAGPKVSMTVDAILAKYRKGDQAKFSRIDPLYLTTGTTNDMQQFLFDMKTVTMIIGRDNPNLSADEVVDLVIQKYAEIDLEVNELDVYVAMTYDSIAKVDASKTAYEQWKSDLKKIAKQSELLVRAVASNSQELTERLRQYKSETGRPPRLSDISGERAAEYTLIKEITERLRAQASAFEISPDEFRWLMDNINALDGHYEAMYRLDYPLTEQRLNAVIANVRNIESFMKVERVEKAMAVVDEKIAKLNSITDPKARYLAIAELASINVAKFPGQQILDKGYEHPDLIKVRAELANKRAELNRLIQDFRANNGSKVATFFRKTMNTIRAAKTSVDHSAVLNQGGPALRAIFMDELIKLAKRASGGPEEYSVSLKEAFVSSFRDAVDQYKENPDQLAEQSYQNIINDPLYNVMKMAGLAITKPQEGGVLAEEYFQESWIDDLGLALKDKKNIGAKVIKALGPKTKNFSEVLYVSYLNSLRSQMFKQYYETAMRTSGGHLTTEEMKLVAETINVFTGRASKLGSLTINPALSKWFWAPRYYMAQIKSALYVIYAPIMYARATAQTKGIWLDKKEIAMYGANTARQRVLGRQRAYQHRAKASLQNLAMLSIFYGSLIAAFKGFCGEDSGLGLNYTKGDFLKIRCNDQVIDISSGLSYWARFATQSYDRIRHAHDPGFGVQDGYFGRSDFIDLAAKLIMSDKLNPIMQTIKAVTTNRDFFGVPYGDNFLESMWNISLESLTPIAPENIWELWKTEDVSTAFPLTFLVFLGMNYYRSDSSLNNLAVQASIERAKTQYRDMGKHPTQITARAPKGLTKGQNPAVYSEYKKEWEQAFAKYVEENPDADYRAYAVQGRKINRELQKKYLERLERGEF